MDTGRDRSERCMYGCRTAGGEGDEIRPIAPFRSDPLEKGKGT
jgi:hypothetical protein